MPLEERHATPPDQSDADLRASLEDGLLVLRGSGPSRGRRVLFAHDYGMAEAWRRRRREPYPGQHLYGCLELARMGYEILLPDPSTAEGWKERAAHSDRTAARIALTRLGRNDVVWSSVGAARWLPALRRLGALRARLVLCQHSDYPIPWASGYDAVAAMTPAALRAAQTCPRAHRTQLGWGVELGFYPPHPYEPEFALSCGKTGRDFDVIARAFGELPFPARVIVPKEVEPGPMPRNVELVTGAPADGSVSYTDLRDVYYRRAALALVTIRAGAQNSFGLTSLLEAMATARPVVVTRTRVLREFVDVEREGFGLWVEPDDAEGLRDAVRTLFEDPARAAAMGRRGREVCERDFSLEGFALGLHELFERL